MSTAAAEHPLIGLSVRGLHVARGADFSLQQLNFELRGGNVYALLGPNGAGKSTLLESLLGSLRPSAGEIRWSAGDGAPPSGRWADLPARQRARILALVGREPPDVPLSVRALVELGRLPHRDGWAPLSPAEHQLVEQALADVELGALADRPVRSLSQGERQRAHFARALVQEPRLLLLDEATAHVDLAHREEMLQRLRRFAAQGHLALAAVHDLDLAARHCDGLLILNQGRLVAAGPPEAVLTPALLAEVFCVDAALERDARGLHLRVFGALPARSASTLPALPSLTRKIAS